MVERTETDFIPFNGWYKCKNCGVNETFIPTQCPVCLSVITNYKPRQTEQLREDMLRRREEDDAAW